MRKIVLHIVSWGTIFYISLCIYVFFIQSDLIFFPSKKILPPVYTQNIEELYFQTADNIKLNGWFVDNKSNTTLLFFHGNGGNISYNQERIRLFNELGVNALMFDYRGYGKSEGKIESEEDIYKDGTAAYKSLLDRGIKSENIIIWGQSLGGAIAIESALGKNIAGTIIESTFTSLDEKSREEYWFLPTPIMLRFHFQNAEKVGKIKSPVLIIHSPEDEVFNIENGRTLFEKAREPKIFLTTKGSHNGGFQASYELYKKEIGAFISEHKR